MAGTQIHHFPGRDGVRLAYRELGQGRPLILIHGYLGTAQVGWIDSGIAGKFAGHGYRVILPDLAGLALLAAMLLAAAVHLSRKRLG